MDYKIAMLKKFSVVRHMQTCSERIIKNYALQTHNCSLSSFEATEKQINRIARMKQNAEKLQTMTQAVVSSVNEMDKDYRLLLVLFYVKKADKNKICAYYSFSRRTMYRKLNAALKEFSRKLEAKGFTEEWFLETYGTNWL